MEYRVSNADNDAEVKKNAMDYILREICLKFKQGTDPTFSIDEIQNKLRGLDERYVQSNIRDLFRGSPFPEIVDLEIRLTNTGKRFCRDNQW